MFSSFSSFHNNLKKVVSLFQATVDKHKMSDNLTLVSEVGANSLNFFLGMICKIDKTESTSTKIMV